MVPSHQLPSSGRSEMGHCVCSVGAQLIRGHGAQQKHGQCRGTVMGRGLETVSCADYWEKELLCPGACKPPNNPVREILFSSLYRGQGRGSASCGSFSQVRHRQQASPGT